MENEPAVQTMKKEPSVEVRAVIAAAVYVTLGAKARISSVEQPRHVAAVAAPQASAWSLEGRREIHSGHRVR
jgi:hypothetical protein